MNLRRSVIAFLGLSFVLASASAGSLQAQQQQQQAQQQQANRGSVTGIVKDETSGQPLSNAQVQVSGTAFGGVTNAEGRYNIANLPAGIYTLTIRRIGYSPTTVPDVRVAAGAPTARDITLSVQGTILSGVVTTGVVDPTSGDRAPFSVAQVSGEKLEVAAMNSPLEVLVGKVAGLQIRGGTLPGSNPVIQIRNPLSVTGYTQPMIIVDGVIQMQDDPTIGARSYSSNPLDLNGDNIESIEVVRGAAAAALYGQRAANGVINITTKRGSDLSLGTTRMTLTNEGGFSKISKQLPENQHHRWWVDHENQFIDPYGRRLQWENSQSFYVDPNLFVDNEWGVPIYSNVRALYKLGRTYRNNMALTQNNLATNFSLSGSALHESGIMRAGGGTSRQNLGVNIDYRAGNKLNTGMGLSFAKVYTALLATATTAFLNAQNICKCIDITKRDPATGQYYPHPDGVSSSLVNPLYFEGNRDEWDRRIGAQANATANYRLTSVFSIRGTGGYSRSDREEQEKWIPIGTIYDTGSIAAGEYDITQSMDETYNGNVRLGILTGMGGWTIRAGAATGGQMQKRNSVTIVGDTLTQNARDYDFIRRTQVSSIMRDVRAIDHSANIAFDYNQKYILDVVYRADGSSLLPPATRWRSNGRASAAWAMSEESWWPLADFNLFKPRYSIGTAGNNPSYQARFELYNQLSGNGVVRINKTNLGNENIVPEEVTEQEFGLDMTFRNRYSMSLTYVRNTVKNTIRADTILAYSGFDTQQSNLGDLRGDAYEATIDAQWIQRRDLRWSSTLVLDRGRQKITRYPRMCETGAGNTDANSYTLNRACEGYIFGQMYGRYHITDVSELSPRHRQSGTAYTHFGHNDEGLLVPLGPNSSYTDMRWGQPISIDGLNYSWGLPLTAGVYNSDGTYNGAATKVIGQGLPDVSFGLGNSLTVGNWSVNVQTVGQLGGVIFNQAKNRSINREVHAELDQFGKPDYLKKPISYYFNSLNSSTFYGGLTGNRILAYPRFLESGTFLKVSELRLAYRLTEGLPVLRTLGMTGGSISLVTRDLLTLSNYSGYDPQVSGTTNATTARVDNVTAPNYKNITAQIRLLF